MTKKKSIKKNYFYNLLYQLFGLITPLIVMPYISRVLGSSGVGQYAFAFSISTYFTLLAALGFGTYAQREIAKHQGDKYKQSIVFWEIFLARLIPAGVSVCIYLVLILLNVYGESTSVLMVILTINVVSVVFDIAYLFQGNENFSTIVLRNIIIKTIGVVLVFVFVKKETDVWVYALCQSVILIVSNLSLWTRLPSSLVKVSPKEFDVKRHFIPTLRLFIPTIAVSVYTILDKTLIGVMVSGVDESGNSLADVENGMYEQSEKLVKMALTIVTSLGLVMIPRNSQAIASGDNEEFRKNVLGALKFVLFVGTPVMFGMAAIAKNLSPWFFGNGYEKVPTLIMIFSPLILIIGFSNVLGLQYLIPLNKDSKYTIAIVCGAVLNLVLNLVLIPLLWSYGACIATISAELCVTILMFFFSKKDISFLSVIKETWKYLLSGTIMFIAVFLTQYFLVASILNTLILIAEGVASYFAVLLILKDKMFIDSIKKFFARKKRTKE